MTVIPDRLPVISANELGLGDLGHDDYRWLVERRARKILRARAARSHDSARSEPELSQDAFERVIAKTDFLPANFLSLGQTRARAVCRIEMRSSRGNWSKWGTGFLIAPGLMMTNNHVLEAPDWALRARALFNDQLDDAGNPLQPTIFELDPESVFLTHKGLDFSIVGIRGEPGRDFGWIPLLADPHTVGPKERVNIIQHPDGRRKEITIQDNQVDNLHRSKVRYRADTEPGSSGSPVFNNAWELVALHHAGGQRDRQGVFLNNQGIRIASIVQYLERVMNDAPDESAREALHHVEGTNPWNGIFGSWGRQDPDRERRSPVDDGRDELERVVYDYQGNSAFADIGFWNIRDFNGKSSTVRRRRVADLLEHMALDAIGLLEVSEDAVAWVVEELAARGHNYGYVFEDASGERDLAIIYDRDTLDVQKLEWSDDAVRRLKARAPGTGKQAWYRLPLLAKISTKSSAPSTGEPFDCLMVVVHAKATVRGDGGVGRRVRAFAAKVLAKELEGVRKRQGNSDFILGGDFNARLEEASFGALSDRLSAVALTAGDAASGDPDAYTYLGSHRSLIDHIYITPSVASHYDADSISITRVDREIPKFRSKISDHAPVIARFTFWGKGPSDVDASGSEPDGLELQLDSMAGVPSETGRSYRSAIFEPRRIEVIRRAQTIARRRDITERERVFREELATESERVNLLAEGDSWFDYPRIVEHGGDLIDHLHDMVPARILNLAHAGHEVQSMLGVEQSELLQKHLGDEHADFQGLLFSGGGNDIVGDPMLGWIQPFRPGMTAQDGIDMDRFEAQLSLLGAAYERLFEMRDRIKPDCTIFLNGYDFAMADGRGVCGRGPWLKPSLVYRGWDSFELRNEIVRIMLGRFEHMLSGFAANREHVVLVPTQGTLSSDEKHWDNELHPKRRGFEMVAEKFAAALSDAKVI